MADNETVVVGGNGGAGWFVAGALIVAAVIGGFLYTNGYFDKSGGVEIKPDGVKIEIPAN
ncbi:hypothetical protein GA830_14925 [Mesorhizobium sp. NBSH29]|uniref:hypothetical protein n=1 Tax=Mesorhizobium sp. NBSH29 TaxID=2654249 RepID=UPI0018969633|nr:hypothetical protein [Mesorhizobium sp. NBSH29]QPC87896.1 hypothetical protein GA830_14925 [Mesorhizobium sp. NBSH29]